MIFLSGCQTTPGEIIKKQRFIELSFVEINGERYIDPKTSFCVEREYKYSINHLGPITKFQNVPIEKCNRITGYSPKDYTEVHYFLDDVRKEIQSHE